MSSRDIPRFLANGTFSWGMLDYHYSESVPNDLLAPSSLESSNPWIVLGATLEHAKNGNHTPISALENLIHIEHPSSLLTRATLDLIGTAGTQNDLEILRSTMLHSEDYLAKEACRAACCAGCLSLVPSMLAAWGRMGSYSDRESISLRLSQLLEEWDGPIGSMRSSSDAEEPFSDAEYATVVQGRMQELRAKQVSEHVPVILGKLFGVATLAQYMYKLTQSGTEIKILRSMFYFLRHKFDASTGINCSGFFKDGEFQPLCATAILEEFLNDGAAEGYEEGVRYFFGHRIPE